MLVRVVLDTCTVRNHLHPIGTRFDFGAIRSSREQLRFSLAGGTGVELLEQLTDGRLSWADWTGGIPLVDAILDQRWPLLPTGKQLAALAGTQTDIVLDIEAERRHLRACWRLQRYSNSTSDLQRGGWYEAADGQRLSIKLELPKLDAATVHERKSWSDYIHDMQARVNRLGIKRVDESTLLALMKTNSGTYPGDPPDMGEKLDAVGRMIARFVAISLEKDGYNPDTTRRRGDTFDISLLFYVPLPCVICTADERFVNRLRGTNALHSRQVITIPEFNEHVARGTVGTLVSDFRTPEEQHTRWQEAAYYRWIEKGRPLGKDWADWFETEPIA